MTRSLLALALLAAACRADEAADADRPASPPLPAPKGLTFVKHGDLRSPEGFEVKAVAYLGAGARAMAFSDDGTLYVLRGGKGRGIVSFTGEKFARGKFHLPGYIDALTVHGGRVFAARNEGVTAHRPEKPEKSEWVMKAVRIVGLGVGPDGWLYVCTGEGGESHVKDADGVETTVGHRAGAVFRCTPEGKRLHLFALGTRRLAGPPAFDPAGNVFHIDADLPDAGRFTGCRLLHVADQADYGYRLAPGAKGGKPDPDRAAAFGERPGTVAPLLKTGRGDPSGLFAYHDTRLPEAYRGLLLYPDPHDRTLRAYRVEPNGATFRAAEEFSLLAGGEEFRPVAVTSGPDGAIYVLERGGRLLRMTWKGTADEEGLPPRGRDGWAKVAKLDEAEAVKQLGADDASVRERARLTLMRLGDKARPALLKVLSDDELGTAARLQALAALRGAYDADVRKGLLAALASGHGDLQRAAAEELGLFAKSGDKDVHDALLRQLAEEDPGLKRAVALAMARVAGPGAADNLAATLPFDDGKCPVLSDGLLRALEALGKPGIAALLALMDSGSQKQIDRTALAFLGLRSRAAFDALPRLMRNPHLSARQRAALVRSSVRYPGVSLAALAEAVNDPKEAAPVKQALREALATPGVDAGR